MHIFLIGLDDKKHLRFFSYPLIFDKCIEQKCNDSLVLKQENL